MSKKRNNERSLIKKQLAAQYTIEQLHEGNEQMFKDIVHLYAEPLTQNIKKLMTEGHIPETANTADDIFQEVVIGFWINKQSIKTIEGIGPYVYRSAFNRCCNQRNANKSACSLKKNLSNHIIHTVDNVTRNLEMKEVWAAITNTVKKASKRKQEVFQKRIVEGVPNEEGAVSLDMSRSTYYSTWQGMATILKKEYPNYMKGAYFG